MNPGWDEYFGWGRIDAGRAALAAFATLPASTLQILDTMQGLEISTGYAPGATYQLFRAASLPGDWLPVPDVTWQTNGNRLLFLDSTSAGVHNFYRLSVRLD